jgi:hypothetical protein
MTKIIKCAYCGGKGKNPFEINSRQSDCMVCNGIGRVVVDEPMEKCNSCSGSGKNPRIEKVPCIVCGGTGISHSSGNFKTIHSHQTIGGERVTFSFN